MRHEALEGMHYQIRLTVTGYDYLFLFPEATASSFMKGNLVTYAYGIPILVFILLLVVLLIWGIIRLVKGAVRRMKRRKPKMRN